MARGGAWGAGLAQGLLTARLWAPETFTNPLFGFRLAHSPAWADSQGSGGRG